MADTTRRSPASTIYLALVKAADAFEDNVSVIGRRGAFLVKCEYGTFRVERDNEVTINSVAIPHVPEMGDVNLWHKLRGSYMTFIARPVQPTPIG